MNNVAREEYIKRGKSLIFWARENARQLRKMAQDAERQELAMQQELDAFEALTDDGGA